MSNDPRSNGEPPPSIASQPKLLPPLRNASLHHRHQQSSTQDSNERIADSHAASADDVTRRPSMPAAATAAAVAVRLARTHNLFGNPSTTAGRSTAVNNMPSSIPSTRHYYRNAKTGRGGGIYAATTAVQQDIVRLERDLQRLVMRPHARNNRRMSSSSSSNHSGADLLAEESTANRRSFFPRYSRADLLMTDTTAINEDVRTDKNRINTVLDGLRETIEKHKLATQLPLAGEILGILSVPFSQYPLDVKNCNHALDLFDYIRERFKHVDPAENLEQILFCCRLLKCGDLKLKMRLIATLKLILASAMDDPDFLPPSFAAFHSLVYTLADALAYATLATTTTTIPERPFSRHETEFDHIRSSIFELLDKLSNGQIVPLEGGQWNKYWTSFGTNLVPPSVARFVVVESLCRSLSAGAHTAGPDEARAKLILQELLPRYWQEPDSDTQRGYLSILYCLSQVAREWLLAATSDDIQQPGTTVRLIIQFFRDKVTPSALLLHLSNWQDDADCKSVLSMVMSVVVASMSVSRITENKSSSRRSSPHHSPQPSASGIHTESGNLWPGDQTPDHLSIDSGTERPEAMVFKQIVDSIRTYFENFWSSDYQLLLLDVIRDTVEDADWDRLTIMYENIAFGVNITISEKVVGTTLPVLIKRLASTFPSPTPPLSKLLFRLSQAYRPHFYRPFVACVASDDEHKICSHLSTILCLRKYLSGVQLWMHDFDMINVLLLSDVGSKKGKEKDNSVSLSMDGTEPNWGSTTLGQCVIALEFLWTIKELRERQDEPLRDMEEDEVAKKFLIDLERRMSVFITAKEKLSLIPIPMRVLLCNIFYESRFFCNTTHRPGWLSRALEWATQGMSTSELYRDANNDGNDRKSLTRNSAALRHHFLDDISLMFQRFRIVYAMAVDHLEAESTHEAADHTDRPVSSMPTAATKKPSLPSDSTIRELVDLSTDEEKQSGLFFPAQIKRNTCIGALYPITPAAAASLDINPPHLPKAGEHVHGTVTALAKKRLEGMGSIKQDPFGAVFSLLVAVFSSLSNSDFSRLIQPLWERFINDRNPRAFIPAAFLLLQCGEKVPKSLVEMFTHDFYSADPFHRLSAIEKLVSLTGYRFNISAQEFIPTSSRNRPFRGDGGVFSTPFIPTDLGSDRFTMDEPRWMSKLKHASNFPIELKRQIQELGWDDSDQGEEQETLKKVLTPLALLPSLYLEEQEESVNDNAADGVGLGPSSRKGEGESKQYSISKIIARRKRGATVHALTAANLGMVDLLGDDFGPVSSSLRELLESYMRDDPALFLRPFLGGLGKCKVERHRELLTRVRYLVNLKAKLPPGFAYILFNYLAGMLKWLTRENKADGLVLMTLIHPILAELILSTHEISMRDLRKNKIEHLVASTGRFWFTHEQPASMFPRALTELKTPFCILEIPWQLFVVGTLRISHIQFLTNFLIRYPREVYAVKKTLQEYEPTPVPGSRKPVSTVGDIYFPDISLRKKHDTRFVFEGEYDTESDEIKPVPRLSQQEEDIGLLSALRARVWLRFIDTLLNGLNKNYNDRAELERILRGVNMIIMEYHQDFGIIGQALVLYTRIVTRFKRLFVSNRGYSTFLPALFKVFCEVERLSHVRSAIIFAWCRFYAVHEESFVFQMLGTLVPLILSAYEKSVQLGAWMSDNLYNIMHAMHNPPRLGATSDVLGLQLQVELDDHERSIQERIDAASDPMAMPFSTSILKPFGKNVTSSMAPLVVNNYDNRPFHLPNFVKLFLTIIAYDPGSLRAEQFVKMFRHMLPRFCTLGHLDGLVNEGIIALIDVFLKFSKTAKPAFANATGNAHGGGPHISINIHSILDDRNDRAQSSVRGEATQHAYGKQWQQNDRLRIKKEFVLLVNQFFKNRGTLNEANHEKMAQIIRIVLRDYASIRGSYCATDWIKNYLIDCLHAMVDMRNYTKAFRTLLVQIYGQYRTQWKTVDAADLYEGLAIVLEQGQGKAVNMHDIAGVMKDRFVPLGLMIATRPSEWEQGKENHTRFCNALVRLIVAIMENSTQDVLSEIERLSPSVPLLGKVVIPLCLQYDLRWDYGSIALVRRFRPEPTSNWMRLMGYVSKACSQASLLKSKPGGFSLSVLASNMGQTSNSENADATEMAPEAGDLKQTPTSTAHLFSLSILAMKAILIRGFKSFDKVKGSWFQVAFFVKSILIFGQSLKALKPKRSSSGRSTPRTPQSPAISPLYPTTPKTIAESARSSFQAGASAPEPPLSISVLYDYSTWCFLEFVVSYKTPMMLLLREFVHEKLRQLGSSSRNSMLNSPGLGGRPHSPATSFHQRPRWRSWGYNASPVSKEDSDVLQVNTSEISQRSATQPQSPDASPTCGVGLHIPSSSRQPPSPSSPALSVRVPSEWTVEEGEQPDASGLNLRSPKNETGHNKRGTQNSLPHSSTVPGELQTIHAHTIHAVVNIQACMGYRPTVTGSSSEQVRQWRWTYREAVEKVAKEWRLIMQLYEQVSDEENPSSLSTTASP